MMLRFTETQAEIYDLIENRFRRLLVDADSWSDKLEVLRRARPIRLMQAASNPDFLNSGTRTFMRPELRGILRR